MWRYIFYSLFTAVLITSISVIFMAVGELIEFRQEYTLILAVANLVVWAYVLIHAYSIKLMSEKKVM